MLTLLTQKVLQRALEAEVANRSAPVAVPGRAVNLRTGRSRRRCGPMWVGATVQVPRSDDGDGAASPTSTSL